MAALSIKTLDDLLAEGVSGRGVLVRSDLNVPLDGDRNITDPGRIIASVPTLQALSDAGAKVVVTAHLGRPKDGPDPKFSLAPVAPALGERLGRHVAVKLLHVSDENDGQVRFLREAQVGARLHHESIVSVYDVVGVDEGIALIMEFVEGDESPRAAAGRRAPAAARGDRRAAGGGGGAGRGARAGGGPPRR